MGSDGVPDVQSTEHQQAEGGADEADHRETRSGMEDAPLHGVRGDLRERAAGSDRELRGTLGGRVRADDPADEFFRDYARESGITLAYLQREAGILTRHQEAEIRKREVPLDSQDTTT